MTLSVRAAVVTIALLAAIVFAWQIAVGGAGPAQKMDPDYAKLMGTLAVERVAPGPFSIGRVNAIELVVTIQPEPCSISSGTNARTPRTTPNTLIS